MTTDVSELVQLARWAGEPARDLALLAEGNVSAKHDGYVLVKASGAFMATAEADDFVGVDPHALNALIDEGTATDDEVAAALSAATVSGRRRPSVETLLHVVCQRYEEVQVVLHTHPVAVNALLCSVNAAQLADTTFFPDQIVTLGTRPVLMPYIDPGLPLAHAAATMIARSAFAEGGPPKVVYLRNHGIFALGGSVAEAQQITTMAVKTARIVIGAIQAGGAVALSDDAANRIHTRPDELFRRQSLRQR